MTPDDFMDALDAYLDAREMRHKAGHPTMGGGNHRVLKKKETEARRTLKHILSELLRETT